jgi:flagellar biosynthetic protein FliO
MGDTAAALPTLGWGSLAMSFASLGVVCVLAFVALKWLAGRGVGRAGGAVKVLARCPLEPRRSVYLIETAGRCFLVGVGDGPMSLLAEVDGAKIAENLPTGAAPRGSFAEVLARVLARPSGPPSEPKP